MARYTGPKTKLSKRVGKNLFLKGSRSYSAKDDFSKKPNTRPGVHGAKRLKKTSEYSKQLLEKQTLKYSYGIQEKDRKSTRLNSSHRNTSRMPSSA